MTMVSSAVPDGARPQVSNDQNIKLTLVIGDDHLVFLDALSDVLGQQNFSVSAASTLSGIIDAVEDGRPDVCLIDRRFCRPDGPDIIGQLIAASPGTKILVLSADPHADGVLEALKAGASGYLHKTRGIGAHRGDQPDSARRGGRRCPQGRRQPAARPAGWHAPAGRVPDHP